MAIRVWRPSATQVPSQNSRVRTASWLWLISSFWKNVSWQQCNHGDRQTSLLLFKHVGINVTCRYHRSNQSYHSYPAWDIFPDHVSQMWKNRIPHPLVNMQQLVSKKLGINNQNQINNVVNSCKILKISMDGRNANMVTRRISCHNNNVFFSASFFRFWCQNQSEDLRERNWRQIQHFITDWKFMKIYLWIGRVARSTRPAAADAPDAADSAVPSLAPVPQFFG